MSIFDPIWASDDDALIDTPSAAETRRGFECGPASPGRFNWLFRQLQQAINAIGDIGALVPMIRQVNTTEGLQGGGALTANRTLRLDVDGLEERVSIANDDWLIIYDDDDDQHFKITRANLVAGLGGEGGSLTGAANIGDGEGEIFSALDGTDIQLRTIDTGTGLVAATVSDKVVISFAELPAELTVE